MIVSRDTFDEVLTHLSGRPTLALDTETTGLRPYHGHEFFSIVMHDGQDAYYFNFNEGEGVPDGEILEAPEYRQRLAEFLREPRHWFMHNAKFDLAMLFGAGWPLAGDIHDTMAVARILDSTLRPSQFSLDECAYRAFGERKLDAVKAWIHHNKAFTVESVPGKKTRVKNLHFSLVPFDLIVSYAERDAELTFRLGMYQLAELRELDDRAVRDSKATTAELYDNECKLTRTVFEMEALGVKIDRAFCQRAIEAADVTQARAVAEIEQLAGEPFKDSTLFYQRAFQSVQDRWVYGKETPTGKRNPSFDSDVLSTFDTPLARAVVDWRRAKSDANYYHGFLYEADSNDVIHTSFNQHVTVTGRFSSSNPNLQNLTKDEDEDLKREYVVRRAIVPRSGMVFHMLDYQQMEYRLMLDYAARYAADDKGVLALIQKVLSGLDVHQATADIAGISRREAKTANFATLYGSGIANLASRLGTSESRARDIRDSIFRAAPEIERFIKQATQTAEKRGYVINWLGRRCLFPDARFAYRAPNHLIQGGCADVVKIAMNRIRDYLQPFRTRLVLTVHDELVLEGPPEEAAEVVLCAKHFMQTVFPSAFLPLTASVEHSFKSLADKEKGISYADCSGVSKRDHAAGG